MLVTSNQVITPTPSRGVLKRLRIAYGLSEKWEIDNWPGCQGLINLLTLFDMGGGGIRPPSSFFEVYEKVLEVETWKSVTFQEM